MARTPGSPTLHASATAHARRRAVAVELRIKGWSEVAIAQQVGVHQSTVSRWLTSALHFDEERVRELAPHLRALDEQRGDKILKRMLARIEDEEDDNDIQAAAVLVRLLMWRAKAYGLNLERPDAGGLIGPVIIEVPSATAHGILGLAQTTAHTPLTVSSSLSSSLSSSRDTGDDDGDSDSTE